MNPMHYTKISAKDIVEGDDLLLVESEGAYSFTAYEVRSEGNHVVVVESFTRREQQFSKFQQIFRAVR